MYICAVVVIYFAAYAIACVNACVHRQRVRARACEEVGVCVHQRAKVKYAAAPASRSIMRRVTHASLLHCEPCYASARQGARRIYGGISAVIERYAPSSRYLFLPVDAPHRLSARLRSFPRPLPRCCILRVRAAAKATGIGFDVFRKY